jgi:hypothetical protein
MQVDGYGALTEPQNLGYAPQQSAEPPGTRVVVGGRGLGASGRRGGAVGRYGWHRRGRGRDRRAGRPATVRSRRRGPARANRRSVRAGVAVRSKRSRALCTELGARARCAIVGGPGSGGLRRARSPRTVQLPSGRNGATRTGGPAVGITVVGRHTVVDRCSCVVAGAVAGAVAYEIAGKKPQPSDRSYHRHHGEHAREADTQAAAPPGHDDTPLARNDQLPGSPHGRTSCPS